MQKIWGLLAALFMIVSSAKAQTLTTLDVTIGGGGSNPVSNQFLGTNFTPVLLTQVNTDTASGYNATTGVYTVPTSGLYTLTASLRLVDMTTPANFSTGITTVPGGDGPWMVWSGFNQRQTATTTRTAYLTVGTQIAMYGYCASSGLCRVDSGHFVLQQQCTATLCEGESTLPTGTAIGQAPVWNGASYTPLGVATTASMTGLAMQPNRSPLTYSTSSGTQMGKSYVLAVGNSTVVGTENFVTGMIGSGFMPITHRDITNGSMNCDVNGNCTIAISNTDDYIQVGQYITWYNEYPNCLAQNSFPVTAASTTSMTFSATAGSPVCSSMTAQLVNANYTNQFVKCAQNGGTLASYLAGGGDCPQSMAISLLQQAVSSGLNPIVYFRGYSINDLRQGGESFSTALANIKTAISNLNAAVPNVPIVFGSENSITQAADGYVTPIATTVTSSAISAGTNTVTVASMPYSIYPGAPAPIEIVQPNGTPFQVLIDSGGTNPETLNITAMTPTTITFTNAYPHAASFSLIATQATAAQVLTNALHETGVELQGVYSNVSVFDVQSEVCGNQSAPAANITCNYNSLHPGTQGQWTEGAKLAQRISSVGSINSQYDDPKNGITFAYNYESAGTPQIGAYLNLRAIDERFSYQCAAQGRNNNFYMPELACPLADEDPNYNTLIVMGVGTAGSSLIDLTNTENPTNYGNGVATGDKVCIRNKGCFTPTTIAPTYNGGVVGDNRYVFTGTNPYATVSGEDTIEIYRPKNVDAGSVAYSQAPLVYPYHLYGTITAATAGTYTITLTGGLNGLTANQTSVQAGDAIVVQSITSSTVSATTTCAPSGQNLVCTDTANAGYTSWAGHLVDIWSTRAPDTNSTNVNAVSVSVNTVSANGVTVAGVAPPAIVIVATNSGGEGATQCYRVTSLTETGESLPSPEVCGTGSNTGTYFFRPYWYPVAGAIGYKVYGRTSGSEQYMGTVVGAPDNQYPTGSPAYTFTDLNDTITPSGQMPTEDTTATGVSTILLAINGVEATANCSTSGSATFSQPFQGTSDKRVMIHMAACIGTASYTYPTAFTNTPSIYASNNAAASIVTSVSTTAVTVTGTTTTGSLVLEDY